MTFMHNCLPFANIEIPLFFEGGGGVQMRNGFQGNEIGTGRWLHVP